MVLPRVLSVVLPGKVPVVVSVGMDAEGMIAGSMIAGGVLEMGWSVGERTRGRLRLRLLHGQHLLWRGPSAVQDLLIWGLRSKNLEGV